MADSPYQDPDIRSAQSSQAHHNGDSPPPEDLMAGQSAEPWRSANPLAIRPPSSVDDGGKSAAEALMGAAEILRNAAETGEKILDAIHATSRQLHSFADFLESNPARASVDKGRRFIKRHPLESVIALAMAAFLLGRALSKLEHQQPDTSDAPR
ncbi:MAG TPA: hypothetical protein VFZ27_00465 [Terriglobia bacterium]|nr:hypothetical protein [Terriglobia bacterium]